MNSFGLGLRKKIVPELLEETHPIIDFVEVVPENWMNVGGYWKKQLDQLAQKYRFVAHGISLSIGSHNALNLKKLQRIKDFMMRYNIQEYSEHLCFSEYDNVHLFELLPLPFTKDAINLLVNKIHKAQDFLERPLILENVCYYSSVEKEMSEADFIREIVQRTGCKILLDINNVYINANNHNLDALELLKQMPLEAVEYLHVAGHQILETGFIIDSHKQAISPQVFQLLDQIYPVINRQVPILLERDGNFNGLQPLVNELHQLENLVQQYSINA
ncbi:MAG: DUF692 domain-containing protein [Saprospiraceae bacterium]|nr:DUF692 domain-containing protein [Saprospiraceae bacterium]